MVLENLHLVPTCYNGSHAVNLVIVFLYLTKRMKQYRKLTEQKAPAHTYEEQTELHTENKLEAVTENSQR